MSSVVFKLLSSREIALDAIRLTGVRTLLTCTALGMFLPLAPGGVARAETAWVHTKVETRGSMGEQVSTFLAFTTSDQAGTSRIVVERLCVKGVGHQVQEKCEDNAGAVELTERATGLAGVGSLCVEARASASWKGQPLAATARACP